MSCQLEESKVFDVSSIFEEKEYYSSDILNLNEI